MIHHYLEALRKQSTLALYNDVGLIASKSLNFPTVHLLLDVFLVVHVMMDVL